MGFLRQARDTLLLGAQAQSALLYQSATTRELCFSKPECAGNGIQFQRQRHKPRSSQV